VQNDTAVVDLMENAMSVVKKGKLTKVKAKEHGQDLIIWKNGEVLNVEIQYQFREKIRIAAQNLFC
jgi:hypothetical protein